jgi:hypothetical protein
MATAPTLGRRAHGAGNKIRYSIDCTDFLEEVNASLTITNLSVALDPANSPAPADAVISGVEIVPSGQIVFFLAGGVIQEVFTVLVRFTDSRGEIKNDSIEFYIVAT